MVSIIGAGVYLSDNDLSGFAGMYGIARLNLGSDYILVTAKPVQYMTVRENHFAAITALGDVDEFYFNSQYWQGRVMIDDTEHEYKIRAFTRNYVIITILEY
jgi:hypothetical protein